MSKGLGLERKLYLGATEVTKAKDVTPACAADQVEASDRSSRYKLYIQGMIDAGAEFEVDADVSYAPFKTLLAAAVNNTVITGVKVEIGGSTCFITFDAIVFISNASQPLADTEKMTFNLKPAANYTTAPAWTIPA